MKPKETISKPKPSYAEATFLHKPIADNNDKLENQMTTLSANKNYNQLRSTKQPEQVQYPSTDLRYRHTNPSDFQQDQLNDSIKKHKKK